MKKTTKLLCMALAMLMLMVSCTKESDEKEILSFRFVSLNVEAFAESDGKTLVAVVPSGTDVTSLVPVILISEKATINPGSGVPMDFTNPVSYVVTAEDGSQAEYSVVVIVKAESGKKILSFRFEDIDIEADIDEDLKTVEATMPLGTDVTALVPVITVSEKATIDPASGVSTDFTNPVTYTVTAEDGSQALYTATVTVEEPIINDQPFVGIWGVEKIEYYNIDYAGNPILESMTTYEFDPNDYDNGIQLVYREDRTGEMLDSSIDTIWMSDGTFICCPDTTVVTTFTYSYNANDSVLYMNMDYGYTYALDIKELTPEVFVYENEYYTNFVEKAYLKRISYMPSKSTGKKSQYKPRKQGSLLGKR